MTCSNALVDIIGDVSQMFRFALERVRAILEKGVSAFYQQFLPFPKCFQKFLYLRLFKFRTVRKELILSQASPGFYVSALQVF